MRRVRIGIIGAGTTTEWSVLPTLLGPDATTPPDTGAWWSRRPVADSDIRYQAPAQPEVVAIADADADRVARVAATARVPGIFGDWRAMLRDVRPEAVICLAEPHETGAIIAAAAAAGIEHLWLDTPPATSSAEVLRLGKRLEGTRLRLWCARPLRRAAAHRAARQLLERDQIGLVSALSLRWSTSFGVPPQPDSEPTADELLPWLSTLGALDLLLALAASPNADTAVPTQVLAGGREGAYNLWIRMASGATASALFAGADTWSSGLPRLEICGTQGRSLVCEAGRRTSLYLPREAARVLEPPGITTHVTAANVAGVAEDIKAFLVACVDDPRRQDVATVNETALISSARGLKLCEAAAQSLAESRCVDIESLRLDQAPPAPPESQPKGRAAEKQTITMKLPL